MASCTCDFHQFALNLLQPAALLIALLGFISTMALAKFLLRGDIIE